MSVKLITSTKKKSAVPLNLASFIPRIFLCVDSRGARVYKGKRKHTEYLTADYGKLNLCMVGALASSKALRSAEKKKAMLLLTRAENSKTSVKRTTSLVKSLDEVFGKAEHCELFNLDDIRSEVKRLQEEDIKEKINAEEQVNK